MTADIACYFFAYGPWAAEAQHKQFFAELGLKAFNEDRNIIERQHQRIAPMESPRMMPFVMDKAVLAYDACEAPDAAGDSGIGSEASFHIPILTGQW